ncbi:LysR family transcriptional regulator [Dactylosporangium sp. CA-092794]|uniref:LysR family transcriptional regulator n=1 Tax=Dactylosporangium sp. CA-092794 TaxID=3239929 RepID=UPI003D8FDDA5
MPRLRLLVALQEHGHLSAAAQAIGIPQSTATRWVTALTKTAGVTLTDREDSRVTLTPAGLALAAAVAMAEQSLTDGMARAYAAGDPEHGEVTFGFVRTVGATKAPRLVAAYRREHPGVRVGLVQAAHEELLAHLHGGSVDVALTVIRDTDAGVRAVELFREPFVLVIPADHRLSRQDYVRVRDFRDATAVGLSSGIALRRSVDELYRAAGSRPRYGFVTDEVATVRGLAAAGAGVAVLPARDGGPLPGSVEVPIVPRTYRRMGLLVWAQRQLEPAAEGFQRWAARYAQSAFRRA